MQVTLLMMPKNNNQRVYRRSSSFKVATFFAALLAIAISALCISIYLLAKQSSDSELNKIFFLLSIVSVISLLIIGVIGYLISVFVVTRINRIANTAQEIISTGDLTKRIEIDSRWDDLSYLGDVLNEMLDKIEVLMEGVKHITDTVAHDLRTPLARLRNKLEKTTINNNPMGQDDIDSRALLISDVDQLLKTFNSLLSLSSLESGRQGLVFESFDLKRVVQDAVGFYLPLAEEKEIKMLVESHEVSYTGDRDLIFQVIANLLDNAIKFTPSQGVVKINIEDFESAKSIIISDNGPGIPNESIPKAFDRFYRDESQRHIEGSGLGLSLVNAVLNLHKASIRLEDNNPGLKVIISL